MADNESPYDEVAERINEIDSMVDMDEVVDTLSKISGSGNDSAKFQQIFGGLNRLPNITPVSFHKEIQGMTLFTRPDLNLSNQNIINLRPLLYLMTDNANSIPYAIRCILDPDLDPNGASSLVDKYSPYISLLSNTLVTMSQPPDIGVTAYTSPEGIMKEQWMMNEGVAFYNGRYDITCTFDNIKGAGTLLLFHVWLLYMSYLRVGPVGGLVPKSRNIFNGVMDYFTRIERFTFDESGRFIEQWWHTGASMPTNLSIGAGFSYNREETHSQENRTISVQFSCVGAVYMDPIQLHEFNLRTFAFNPSFRGFMDIDKYGDDYTQEYIKIPHERRASFNYKGLPYINLSTMEMEWWVPATHYGDEIMRMDKSISPPPAPEQPSTGE